MAPIEATCAADAFVLEGVGTFPVPVPVPFVVVVVGDVFDDPGSLV